MRVLRSKKAGAKRGAGRARGILGGLAAVVAGLTLLQVAPAAAQSFKVPARSEPLSAIGSANPIPGWTTFCQTNARDCAVDVSEQEVIRLTAQAWKAIVTVNRQVNAMLEPMTDTDHWGVSDRWDLPQDGAGDCEDYQLLKRRLLVEAGLPARALRMTVVVDETGEGHAVLMARTDRGDFILDNKHNGVLPWHQTGYTFVKREGTHGTAWVSLGQATGPSATANR
ncbi:MAG TPA: transglutaminase-like cysteine peptidase [Microvirga sp.]|jgi:predicted transglutaminase-like cysteine proteinase|nr:transglutaminase-like cysteine peptidase [Microvirga sp.]